MLILMRCYGCRVVLSRCRYCCRFFNLKCHTADADEWMRINADATDAGIIVDADGDTSHAYAAHAAKMIQGCGYYDLNMDVDIVFATMVPRQHDADRHAAMLMLKERCRRRH